MASHTKFDLNAGNHCLAVHRLYALLEPNSASGLSETDNA